MPRDPGYLRAELLDPSVLSFTRALSSNILFLFFFSFHFSFSDLIGKGGDRVHQPFEEEKSGKEIDVVLVQGSSLSSLGTGDLTLVGEVVPWARARAQLLEFVDVHERGRGRYWVELPRRWRWRHRLASVQ